MKRHYVAACKKSQKFLETMTNDPMTEAFGAPVDEIFEGYMAKHASMCEECRDASMEASMP